MIFQAHNLTRIMGCTGSVYLQSATVVDKPISEQQIEGQAAHRLFTWTIDRPQTPIAVGEQVNGNYIVTSEMIDTVGESVYSFFDHFPVTSDAILQTLVEQTVDWRGDASHDAPDIKCRPDVISYDDATHTLYIAEFKYGWRIVEAENNWQCIAGATGAIINLFPDTQNVVITVYQPRPWHEDGKARSVKYTREEIDKKSAELILRLTVLSQVCTTGTYCYKCPCAGLCPSLRKASLASVDMAHGSFDQNMPVGDLAKETITLRHAAILLKTRIEACEQLIIDKITSQQSVPLFDLLAKETALKWNQGTTADTIKLLTGVDVLQPGKMMTPTQALKAKIDETIVNSFSSRQSDGFKLVQQDLNQKAAKLFRKDN